MDNYCCDIQYIYLQLYFQYGDCQSPAGAGGGGLSSRSVAWVFPFILLFKGAQA